MRTILAREEDSGGECEDGKNRENEELRRGQGKRLDATGGIVMAYPMVAVVVEEDLQRLPNRDVAHVQSVIGVAERPVNALVGLPEQRTCRTDEILKTLVNSFCEK